MRSRNVRNVRNGGLGILWKSILEVPKSPILEIGYWAKSPRFVGGLGGTLVGVGDLGYFESLFSGYPKSPMFNLVLQRSIKIKFLGGPVGGLLGDFFSGSPQRKISLLLTFFGYWGDLGDFF